MNAGRESGGSLLEFVIASALLVPILFAVFGTSKVATTALLAEDKDATLSTRASTTRARIVRFLRPASLGSVRVYDSGNWIAPIDGTAYDQVAFQHLTDNPARGAAALDTGRVLSFELDAAETADGKDNDGDGLVDEGRVFVASQATPNVRSKLAESVEKLTITKVGRHIEIFVKVAMRTAGGKVQRAESASALYMRNK